MAHSYVQAHDREADAFRAFSRLYPETILLVDSYDTLAGVRKVVALARELGPAFRVRGVRLDSGDLGALARDARRILDQAGLSAVEIFASGSLDEYRVAELLEGGAPIDAFGVGTRMGVSADAPDLDLVYKLTAYAGTGRVKTSSGKELLPGRKQVFRLEEDGLAVRDVLATCDEVQPGRPLLEPVLRRGERLAAGRASLADARARAAAELVRLPERLRALEPALPPYPVLVSERLRAEQVRVSARVTSA
jgi:nicotinate phosphoribosyltransferase